MKGPGAFLFKLLAEAGFKPKLRYLFCSQYSTSAGFWVMCDHMIKGREEGDADQRTELEYLMEEGEPCIVWATGESEATAKEDESE